MRTTIRLPDDLYRQAKTAAAQTGMTFTSLLEEALRLLLAGDRAAPNDGDYQVHPLEAGRGLQAGVDLHDQAGLLDVMDGR